MRTLRPCNNPHHASDTANRTSEWVNAVRLAMNPPRADGRKHAQTSVNTKRFTSALLLALVLSAVGVVVYFTLPSVGGSQSTHYIHVALRNVTKQALPATKFGLGTDGPQQQVTTPLQSMLGNSIHSSNGNSRLQAPIVDDGVLAGLLLPEQSDRGFLDAAVQAEVTRRELRQLVQLQQQSFCLAGHHLKQLPGSVAVPFGNVSVYVYGSGDIVSDSLKGVAHGWETAEIQEWLWAIRQWKPSPASNSSSSSSSTDQLRPLTVDVGANLGWFSLNAAAAGARVAAFEAMPANIALIRRSLCASPWLSERIALYDTGLGNQEGACYIISGLGNKGDGFIKCSKAEAYNTPGYEVRGVIPIRLLDTLLQEDVQVMKLDVEGYEHKVLLGALRLLGQHKVHYIMAECNTGIIGEEKGHSFIQFLHREGYEISPMSFRGPFWSASQIPQATCSNINLYARRRAEKPIVSWGIEAARRAVGG